MIELKDIVKEYDTYDGKVRALDEISVRFDKAGLVLVTGENGCGKSTLLNIIASIDNPTGGKIIIDGQGVNYKSRNIFKKRAAMAQRAESVSFIYQSPNLIESMTLESNLEMARINSKITVSDALRTVGLADMEKRLPSELSIGQMQRACIARAIIRDSSTILADEPTASLDPEMRDAIAKLLQQLSKDRLVIVITHNESEFFKYDRKIVMDEGKIISDITVNDTKILSQSVRSKQAGKANPLLQSARTKIKKNKFRFAFNLLMITALFMSAIAAFNTFDEDPDRVYEALLAGNDNGYAFYSGDRRHIKNTTYTSGLNSPFKNISYIREREPSIGGMFVSSQDEFYYDTLSANPNSSGMIYPMPATMIDKDELLTGRMPAKGDEVVINRHFADCMIYFSDNKHNIVYKNYDEIINNGYIYAAEFELPSISDTRKLKIVGIRNDGSDYFDVLKDIPAEYDPETDEIDYSSLGTETGVKSLQLLDRVYTSSRLFYCHSDYNDYIVDYYKDKGVNPYINGLAVKRESVNFKTYGEWKAGAVMIPLSKILDPFVYFEMIESAFSGDGVDKAMVDEILSEFESETPDKTYVVQRTEYSNAGMLYNDLREYPVCGFYDDLLRLITGNSPAPTGYRPGVILESGEDFDALLVQSVNTYNYVTAIIPLDNDRNNGEVLRLMQADGRMFVTFDNNKLIMNVNDFIGQVSMIFRLIGIFVFIGVVVFLIYSTVIYFKNYCSEIGMLMSLGTKMRYVIAFIVSEFLIALAVGLVLGVVLGAVTIAACNGYVLAGLISLPFMYANYKTVLFAAGVLILLIVLPIANALIGVAAKSPVKRMREKI